MGFPITEWIRVTKSYLLARIKNTPDMNNLDKLGSGILYIKIKDTGNYILDRKHISKTYVGTDCKYRYFSLEFTSDVNVPNMKNGKIYYISVVNVE